MTGLDTRTAFAAAGWWTDTVRLPDPARPELLATLTFRPLPDAPTGLRNRPETIERRRTDRLPLREPGDLTGLVRSAQLLSQRYEVMLDLLDAATARRLSAASEHVAAALRHYDIPYLAELYWWSGHEQIPEGIPAAALVSADEAARVPAGREFPPSGQHSQTLRRPISDFLTIDPDTSAAGSGERPAVRSAWPPTAPAPEPKEPSR